MNISTKAYGCSANQMQICVCKEEQRVWTSNTLQGLACRKRFQAEVGVDFFETYSFAANMKSVRVLLAVIVARWFVTRQLNAFKQRS